MKFLNTTKFHGKLKFCTPLTGFCCQQPFNVSRKHDFYFFCNYIRHLCFMAQYLIFLILCLRFSACSKFNDNDLKSLFTKCSQLADFELAHNNTVNGKCLVNINNPIRSLKLWECRTIQPSHLIAVSYFWLLLRCFRSFL